MSANYTFLPWTRQGLANHIDPSQVPTTGRPTIPVNLTLQTQNPAVAQDTIAMQTEILYPGDITGISPDAIIRTVPANNASDFEPYLLASVEFYEEDFPWRFTPRTPDTANNRLAPWLFLMVLEESEFTERLVGSMQVVKVKRLALPTEPAEMWAWAHVQVNNGLDPSTNGTEDFLNEDLPENPDQAFSRLFSPRRLKASTRYHAFLVPSFDTGRKIGINPDADLSTILNTAFSWTSNSNPSQTEEIEFPVYYRWSFRTGLQEDFEFLARQLKPYTISSDDPVAPLDPNDTSTKVVESVKVDISDIGLGLKLSTPQTITLPTVIEPTNINPVTNPPYREQYQDTPNQRDSVRDLVVEGLSNLRPNASGNTKPVVMPPAYGRYHKKADAQAFDSVTPTTTNPNWFQHVNLDLRYRAVTAIGTRVVQERQEDLAQQAWEQLKDVLEANQNLKAMQAGLQASLSMREKHLPLTQTESGASMRVMAGNTTAMEDYGLHVTAPVLSRIKVTPDSNQTLYQLVRESDFPMAALSPAFRKINRPYGKYQINQAGLSLRSDDPSAGLPANPTLKGNEKTTLKHRDSLLSLIADGTIKAASPKPSLINAYQFNPEQVITLLNSSLTIPSGIPEEISRPNLQMALQEINQDAFAIRTPDEKPLVLEDLKARIIEATDPEQAYLARANRAIRFVPHHPEGDLPEGFLSEPAGMRMMAGNRVRTLNKIAPVMAYPVFKQPMYEALKAYNENLFIPGLSSLPQNIISLMQVNDKAVEAYMLGLNHEMASELLWREYPTDQRGSYFRQFWDKRDFLSDAGMTEEQSKDIKPLHEWNNTELGSNDNISASANQSVNVSDLILLIKGDLLRKFPNIIIYAQEATRSSGTLSVDSNGEMLFPIQRADLDADVTILRFQLTASAAKGENGNPGWYFLLAERPGEPRFGMDIAIDGTPVPNPIPAASWNDLTWGHLAPGENIVTGSLVVTNDISGIISVDNGADLAYALFQQPAMIAIHASDMLPNPNP